MFSYALKLTTPVFFGYIAIGIPFGLMMVNAGYAWWIAVLMSCLMYTGSGQYFAVGLLASGAGLFENILVQFLLSVRHFFYGLSLIEKYRDLGIYKAYCIHAITDETFALVSSLDKSKIPANINFQKLCFVISILDQSYWVLGTLIGSIFCTILLEYNLTEYLKGIDFALSALFVVLLIEQLKTSKNYFSASIGAIISLICVVLFKQDLLSSSNIIWISICLGIGFMMMFKGKNFYKENGK